MTNISKRILLFLVGVGIAVVIVVSLYFVGRNRSESKPLIVGYVMTGLCTDAGWNVLHYDGIKKACDKFGATLLVKENILEDEGTCGLAVQELISSGAKIIFLSSYGYAKEINSLIEQNPNVFFYSISSSIEAKNNATYFVRLYQGRYLSGVLAGLMTKTNQIGYVAAMKNTEVIRGLNAFALGVQSVNPDAQVIVNFSGSWDNRNKEVYAFNKILSGYNIDVVSYHQNQPNIVFAADGRHIKSIGYHICVPNCSDNYLCSVVCNWEKIYTRLLHLFCQGKADQQDFYWFGAESGAVDLSPMSSIVSQEIIDKVSTVRTQLGNGYHIFAGQIYDNQGQLRCDVDEMLSDQYLLNDLDWFVRGVKVYEE